MSPLGVPAGYFVGNQREYQNLHAFVSIRVLFSMTRHCLILIASFAAAFGQSPIASKEFDVVSVRPSAPDEHNSFMAQRLPGGNLRLIGLPLRMIIMRAYDVKAFQLSGGPDWVRTDRWDVLAKAEGVGDRLTPAQERPMLQALLRDRFQLKVHIETKEMPVYGLTVERNGPRLVPNTGAARQFRSGNGSLTVNKGAMTELVSWLSEELGRVVVDKTGLKAEYDYTLAWTPEAGQGGPESIGQPPDTRGGVTPNSSDGPSIFTALQQQLGLRLVSQKGPVEIVVLDSAEKPSEN
jgi:bla regulator protein blaR1